MPPSSTAARLTGAPFMSLKIGLEVEFFATKNGKLIDAAEIGVPCDEYPLLVEARGEPFTCAFKAVASVRAEIERIVHLLKEKECRPLFVNWQERTPHVKALHEAILRRGLHKSVAWQNAHGAEVSKKNETHLAAGMHISFTNPLAFNYSVVHQHKFDGKEYPYNKPETHTYNQLFDFSKVFRQLESAFGADVDAAERVRGFYELKSDGRIEYRSLPATLIHSKGFTERLVAALAD